MGSQLPGSKAGLGVGVTVAGGDRKQLFSQKNKKNKKQKHPSEKPPAPTVWITVCVEGGEQGTGSSPDAQCGLDEGGDAHAGEDGTDELADHVLVAAHT